jgi:hypothetical protein
LPDIAAQLPSSFNLQDLAVGTVSFPVAVSNGDYVLIQITSRTPTDYNTASQLVADVVQQRGATQAHTAVDALERHSTISVDPRYGVWVPVATQVLVPFSPQTSDVLNPGANTAGSTPASANSASG